jgi:catechol 2,3-dioxygenase-like lactoylglutathione lyase family enzyme
MKRLAIWKPATLAFAFTAAVLAAFALPAPPRAAPEAIATATADAAPAPAEQGRLVGLAFAGRSVSNLDRSIAFYEALGFELDPAAPPVWRSEEVFQRIDGLGSGRGITTRMAKMYVNEPAGGRFVIYLRELKGTLRRNLSRHTAWDPGASHFGLVVPDAQLLWSRLKAKGMLHALSWGGQLIAPPGQKKGMIAYITDPDGMDIEIIDQRLGLPVVGGRSARPALLPGVNHVGLVVLDSAKARAFYGEVLGGRLVSPESRWMHGDFYDAAVGGHGNTLRFFNESFPDAFEARLAGSDPTLTSPAPGSRINFELVEFQNHKKPVVPARITDIGVGYVGFEVQGLEAFLARARAAGARMVSDGIVTMRGGGTRVAMIRDPDVGGFVELFDHPHK